MTAPPPPRTSQDEWWVISETSGTPGPGSFIVVHGTAAAIKAKYDGAARGPYPTQQAAQAAASSPGGGFPGANLPPLPTVSNPLGFLGYLGEVGHWLGVIVSAITDRYLWISLGWLFLGFVLLIAGVITWLMKYADAGSVAELGAVLA